MIGAALSAGCSGSDDSPADRAPPTPLPTPAGDVVDDNHSKDVDAEFGVLVRAGTRAMVWRGLELYGDFTGSNIGITRNELFFNLGARYHFLADTLDLAIGVGLGTDDFVGLSLSGRVYYVEVWRQLFGD